MLIVTHLVVPRTCYNGFSLNESDLCWLMLFLASSKWLAGPSTQPGIGCLSCFSASMSQKGCSLTSFTRLSQPQYPMCPFSGPPLQHKEFSFKKTFIFVLCLCYWILCWPSLPFLPLTQPCGSGWYPLLCSSSRTSLGATASIKAPMIYLKASMQSSSNNWTIGNIKSFL